MKPFILCSLLLLSWLITVSTEAQVSCIQTGHVTSCTGPRGQNTVQTDLGRGQGVILDDQGRVTPYTIITPQPVKPLNDVLPKLPTLPTLEPASPVQPSAPGVPLFLPGFGGEAGQ